jgi:hypothetical protein
MQTLEFERLHVGSIALDFCFPCQVIWLDTLESLQLSPGGILEVFKALHEQRAPTRNTLPALLGCPRCETRLALTHDVQHATHFTYFRCEFGHGRLTPFFQFLLEKNFVRPVTGAELAALKAKVKMVQCSNCGAPLNTVDIDKLAAALMTPPPPDTMSPYRVGDLVMGGLAVVAALLVR